MYNVNKITKEFLNELEDYFSSPDTFMLGVNFICKKLCLHITDINHISDGATNQFYSSVTLTTPFILQDEDDEIKEFNFFISSFRSELAKLMNKSKNQFLDSSGILRYKFYHHIDLGIIRSIQILYVYGQD